MSMVQCGGDRGKLEATSQKEQQQHTSLNKAVSAEMMSVDKVKQIISSSSAAF
jgi:hypothetical protein